MRHAPTALLICTLDCGKNAGLRVGAEQWDCVASKHWGKLNENARARFKFDMRQGECEGNARSKLFLLHTHHYKNLGRC